MIDGGNDSRELIAIPKYVGGTVLENQPTVGSNQLEFSVAQCQEVGFNSKEDLSSALDTYRKLDRLNYAPAAVKLGSYYREVHDPPDLVLARRFFEKAAAIGHPHAILCLGRDEYESANFEESIELFERAATLGNWAALVWLGICYLRGHGVEADDNVAFRFFAAAASASDRDGIYYAGICYRDGTGTTKDSKRAKRALQEAHRRGHPRAGYLVGLMVEEEADGEEESIMEAMNFYQESALRGCVEAAERWGEYYAFHSNEEATKNRAVEYLKVAVAAERIRASYLLGVLAVRGEVAEMSKGEGFELCKNAADAGLAEARRAVALMYERGDGVARNEKFAKEYRKITHE